MNSIDSYAAFKIANDPEINSKELIQLLSSESIILQCAAIENKNCPITAIENLKHSTNIYIRQALARRGVQVEPLIIKIKRIVGKSIILKNATSLDAEFILHLRNDPDKNQYISSTSEAIEDQIKWLKSYENDHSQAYFVIVDKFSKESVGTVRVYDKKNNSFCWGSWVLKSNIAPTIAIESALLIYQYGLAMGFDESHFDVRKGNRSVWKFHERFGAIRTGETEEDYLYKIKYDAIALSFSRYSKYLADKIEIIPFDS